MAETHHRWTGLLLVLVLILFILMGIFFIVAQSRVQNIPEYVQGNTKLKTARNSLITAYVLAFVAAFITLILAILYFGHIAWNISSEVPHLIMFIVIAVVVIVSGVFGFVALSNISNSAAQNKNGSEGWIWAALGVGLAGLIILLISGAWRAQYKSSHKVVRHEEQLSFTSEAAATNMTAPGYPAPVLPPAAGVPVNPLVNEPGAVTSTYVPAKFESHVTPTTYITAGEPSYGGYSNV